MVLPAPPPRPHRAPDGPTTSAPSLHIIDVDDLPYVAPRADTLATVAVLRPEPLGPARRLERAARVGLVLAVVVALAGVIGVVAKSGDDGATRLASRGGSAVADEDPLADSRPTTADLADPYLVPEGYRVVQGDGIYLSVPASWRTLTDATMSGMFDDESLDEIYPDLDPQLRAAMQAAIDRGAIFMAIDPEPAGGGRNLTILSAPGEGRLGGLAAQVERELEGLGLHLEVRSTREVDTPIGRALRVAYSAEVAGQPFDAVQYYVPADGRTYIVTGTEADDVTDQAIQTLRLGEVPEPT